MRKELRAVELRTRFALERKTLLEGRLSVFQELQEAVEREGGGEYDFAVRVLRCAERFPQDENSYILIGNYLIEYPGNHQYFEHFLTTAPRHFEWYLWSLQVLLFCYLERAQDYAPKELQERLRGIAQMLAQLGGDMFAITPTH